MDITADETPLALSRRGPGRPPRAGGRYSKSCADEASDEDIAAKAHRSDMDALEETLRTLPPPILQVACTKKRPAQAEPPSQHRNKRYRHKQPEQEPTLVIHDKEKVFEGSTDSACGTAFAYVKKLRTCKVSTELEQFLRSQIVSSMQIRAQEAGAGGDCLFHSVGAALEECLSTGGAAAEHILQVVPQSVFNGRKMSMVRHLRKLSAKGWESWTMEDILNFLIAGVFDENSGHWMDGWSPREVLISHGFEQLVGIDTVRAVGPALEGDPGDLTIAVDRSDARTGGSTRAEEFLLISQGASALVRLRSTLKQAFERAGNSHWGMETDVKHLAQALNIGFLVFADGLQRNGTQCLVNLNLQNSQEPTYYVCLWWFEPVHFRLCQLKVHDNAPWQCFFKREDLPPSLRAHLWECNPQSQAI